MDFFLQYNSAIPVGINTEAAQNFGITNINSLYNAAIQVAGQIQKVCIPVVGIALLLKLFSFMTKLYGEKQADFMGIGRLLLLILFLFEYTEIMTQVNSLISYFTESVQIMFDKYGSGHTVVDKVNEVYDKYKDTHPDPGFFDKLSNIMDWVIANCTHMIIIVSRSVTYIIRSLIMVFLFATGPIAILGAMFPGFEGNLKHWLNYYISVGFWAVSLAVLDLILYQYLQYCEEQNSIDGMTTLNIGMALMYLIAPYLTSRYIGGQGSQFMSRVVQSATTAIALSSRISKGAGSTLSYGSEKGNNAARSASGKSDHALSDSGQGTSLAQAAGKMYGGIKNNIIGRNQSEP